MKQRRKPKLTRRAFIRRERAAAMAVSLKRLDAPAPPRPRCAGAPRHDTGEGTIVDAAR